MTVCPTCHTELVEVDNPIRREVRHRRGVVCPPEPLGPVSHKLTHALFSNGTMTPACTCGWYSPNCEHAEFERHLRQVQEPLS